MAVNGVATLSDLEFILQRVLGLIITLAGIASFIMIIVGGFKYLFASGDPKQAESAQATITWAVVGLVIALVMYLFVSGILRFYG